MRIVIVGGVAAGASCAARARRHNEDAQIVMLEKGDYVSFANCGLPYHIGGEIKKRDGLLIVTPDYFRETVGADVRVGHEAIAIDRESHNLRVLSDEGAEYDEPYDRLVLCQGAAPVIPGLPGVDHPRVFKLRDIPDMDAIEEVLSSNARSAAIIGAGYIGLEAAEALRHRGLEVTLVELEGQIMPLLDAEIAADLTQHLEEKGVSCILGTSVEGIADAGGLPELKLLGGGSLNVDLVLLATGVRPSTGLAHAAGLDLGATGGVKVDRHMRTSDSDIYAAGDMVEVTDTVTGEPALIPLAGPANRQGRIIADHIFGRETAYSNTQGTAIVKCFDMVAAITGASEKTLKRLDRPYQKIYLHPYGHASYYPGTAAMHMKVLFDPQDGRILGAQIAGRDGVDKRIDILALAVRKGMTVYELEDVELAYAPPFGSAKDPINMVGFVGSNLLRGDIEFWYADEYPQRTAGGLILDVRTRKEYADWHIQDSLLVPINELRERIDEVREASDGKPVYTYCLTGIRSYLACCMLKHNGFNQVFNLAGGRKTFESYQRAFPRL